MSANIDQIYTNNPITSNDDTDLMYFGQSPYSSGNDAAMLYSNFVAPFQQGAFNYSADGGTADSYQLTLAPAISSLTDGLRVTFTPANTNLTTTPVITVNQLETVNITLSSGPVAAGDISSSSIAECIYSEESNTFILLTPAISQNGNPFATNISVNGLTIGRDPGNSVTSTVVGYQSQATAGGSANTSVGSNSLNANSSGQNNTAIGNYAMADITSGNGNVAVGDSAFQFYSGTSTNNNTAIGTTSLNSGCTGNANTAVGNYSLANGAAGANVAVGQNCASTYDGYSNCTFIGQGTDSNNNDAIGVIAIGCAAIADIATGNTSADNGSGIALGSSGYPVGVRGDGSLYPSAGTGGGTLPLTFTGYIRIKINGTYYKIPLYPDS